VFQRFGVENRCLVHIDVNAQVVIHFRTSFHMLALCRLSILWSILNVVRSCFITCRGISESTRQFDER